VVRQINSKAVETKPSLSAEALAKRKGRLHDQDEQGQTTQPEEPITSSHGDQTWVLAQASTDAPAAPAAAATPASPPDDGKDKQLDPAAIVEQSPPSVGPIAAAGFFSGVSTTTVVAAGTGAVAVAASAGGGGGGGTPAAAPAPATPLAPDRPDATLTRDTGLSATDGITRDASLSAPSNTPSGARVEYNVDNAGWTSPYTAPVTEGSHTVLVRQTSTANLVSDVQSLSFTLDTTLPNAPTLALQTDTGRSATDGITNKGSVTVGGTETDALIEYSTDAGTTWSSSFTAQEGANTVIARQTDLAGNVSASSAALSFTLDTTLAAPSGSLGNNPGTVDGSGSSTAVYLQNIAALSFATPAAGVTRSYTVDGGQVSPSYNAPTGQGDHTIVLTDTDVAGNVVTTTFAVTVDTTAPMTLALSLRQDSGPSNTDKVTFNSDLNIVGTEIGSKVSFSTDGGNTWSSTYTPKEGANSVIARQADLAGNVSANSATLTFTLDTIAPAAPTAVLASDTFGAGTSGTATDKLSKTGTLNVSGVEPGLQAQYSIDDGFTWSTSFTAKEGLNTVYLRQVDAAGNPSAQPSSLTFTLDTIAPGAPALALVSDSGSSATDKLTNNGALLTTGTEAGAKVEYSVNNGSSWSSTFTPAQGVNTVLVRQTDAAGNISSSGSLAFTLDTVAPAAPTVALATDSGSSSTDKASNVATLAVTGTEASATVQYSIDNGSTWAGSFTPAQGANTVLVRQTDAAGNTSAASTALGFTLDTVAPSTLTVALSSDTGSSASDRITKVGTLTVTGAEAGATTSYSTDNGTTWGASFAAREGSNTVLVRQTDAAGNNSPSTSLSFTLDTTAPAAASVAINGDTLVNRAEQGALGYTVTGLEAGATATVTFTDSAGTPVTSRTSAASGSANLSTLVDGSVTVAITMTDVAGNSRAGTGQTVTLDGIVTPTVSLGNDTFGAGTTGSNTDRLTNDAAITVSAAPSDLATRRYSVDGNLASASYVAPTNDGAHTVTVTDTDNAGNEATGILSFTLDKSAPSAPSLALTQDTGTTGDKVSQNGALTVNGTEPGAKLEYSLNGSTGWSTSFTATEGANTVYVRQTDVAGNVSAASSAFSFTKDTTVAAPTVALSSDTAGAGTTGTTTDKVTSNGALTVSGTEPGAKLEYSLNGSTGWSTSFTAAEGANTVYVRQTDAAGNVSAASSAFSFTKDTTVAAPTVALSSDTAGAGTTGTTTDKVTSNGGLTVSGTEPGAKLEYSLNGSTGWSTSFTATEGANTVYVRQTDAAGNVSAASSAFSFTKDTTVAAPTVALSSDTAGAGTTGTATDKVTSNGALTVNGTEPGAKLEYSLNGSTGWSTSFTATEGANTVYVRQTDVAGNVSAASSAFSFTKDSTPPPALSIAVTGDAYVNAQEQAAVAYTVIGLGSEAASTVVRVTFTDSAGHLVSHTAVNGQGSVNLSGFAEGLVGISYVATDIAGNTVTGTSSASLTLDRSIARPTVALTHDTGSSSTDGITSDASITPSAAPADIKTRLYTVDGQDATSYVAPSSVGVHTVVVTDTDLAGNTASSTTLSFTLDTSRPPPPVLSLAFDTGSSATDSLTNNGAVTVSGTQAGATVEYSLNNGTSWSTTYTAPVTSGSYSVIARQTSSTGTVSANSAALSFTLDKLAPAAPSLALTQDTGTAGDKVSQIGTLTVSGQEAGATIEYSLNGSTGWSSTAPTATEGANTVYVRQTDAAGNTSAPSAAFTFTKDTTAPSGFAVTINGGDALVNRAEQPALGYTVSGLEAGATAIVLFTDHNGVVATSNGSSGSGTVNLSGLADGTVTVDVRSIDAAGNTGTGTDQTITLDGITTPTIALLNDTFGTLTVGTASDLITKDASLNLSTAPADLLTRSYKVDGGSAVASYVAPTADGSHTVVVTDTDRSGNVASASLTFTLDKTVAAPLLALSYDSGTSASDHITTYGYVTASNLEAGAYLEYSVDNGVNWTGNYNPPAVNGNHTVIARQIDVAGNVSANSLPLTFTIDTSLNAPTLTLQTTLVDENNLHNVGYTISGLDSDATAYVLFTDSQGHNVTGTNNTADFGSLSDGQVTATVYARDTAGNYKQGSTQTLQLDAFSYQSLSASGNTVVLTFSRALDTTHLPTASEFKLMLNDELQVITGISASGQELTLTLAEPLRAGNLSIDYSDASYNSLDAHNIRSTNGNYETYFYDNQTLDIAPTVSKIVSSHSLDLDTFTVGSTADILVYFSSPVSITGSGTPTLTLTIKAPDGSTHDVVATYVGYNGDVLSYAHNSLNFSYTTASTDVGSWSVKSVNLNGSQIVSNVNGVVGSLAANLSLATATPDFSGNSYFYGGNLVHIGSNATATGTAANEILVWNDPSTVPAAFTATSNAVISGIDGGAGNRDLLSLPIFLADVSTAAVADAYTLSFNASTNTIRVFNGAGVLQKTIAVPQGSSWPAGIEGIYYEIQYKDGNGNIRSANDGDTGLLMSKDTLVLQDSSRPTDFFVEGSYLADTIDVSTSLTLTGGGTHAVTASDRIVIRGEAGNDTIIGHSGTDIVFGNQGSNTINAGAGNDVINLNSGSGGTNVYDGGADQDSLRLTLQGNQTAPTFNADGSISLGSKQTTWVNGVKSTTATYGEQYKFSVDEATGKFIVKTQAGGTTTVSNVESLTIDFQNSDIEATLALQIGSSGNDKLTAAASSSLLYGLAGDDVLKAAQDGDVLNGGSGNDTLVTDAKFGTAMVGGAGIDTAVIVTRLTDDTTKVVQVDSTHWTIASRQYGNSTSSANWVDAFHLTLNTDQTLTLDTLSYASVGYTDTYHPNTVVATTELSGVEYLKVTNDGGDVMGLVSLAQPSVVGNLVSPTVTVNGDQLTLSFSQALDTAHLPNAASFMVVADSAAANLAVLSVSANSAGTQLTLTLNEPVPSGQLTVSYADPSTGNDTLALQLANGTDLPTFSLQSDVVLSTAKVIRVSTPMASGTTAYALGDVITFDVEFSDAVAVSVATGGALPTLTLSITAPDGSTHTAQATLVGGNTTYAESLTFAYTLTAADVGTYHVDAISLNGASITNATYDGSTTGSAAVTSLSGVPLPIATSTAFYGSHYSDTPTAAGAGTAFNDILIYTSDAPDLPAGVKQGVYTGVNAGAGNRDMLAFYVVLPGTVTDTLAASNYELRYNSSSLKVELWLATGTAAIDSWSLPTDANWPAGVEILAFVPSFRDTNGNVQFAADSPLTFNRSTLVYQNATATDFTVHGSWGNDVINVSTTITPTDGSAHTVASTDRILILGKQGDDTITGHSGFDLIHGGGGHNTIDAGAGNDRIFLDTGSNTVNGGTGTDMVVIGITGNDLKSYSDADGTIHLIGINYLGNNHGVEVSTVTAEQYTIKADEATGLITVVDKLHGDATSTLTSIEQLGLQFSDDASRIQDVSLKLGTSGADSLSTADSDAVIFGLGGNDTLVAQAQGGLLVGGSGDDTFRFSAEAWADLAGGTGTDKAILTVGSELGPLTLSHDSGSLVWNVKDQLDHTLFRLTRDADHPFFQVDIEGTAELGYPGTAHWLSSTQLSSVETFAIQNAVGTNLITLALDDVNKTVAVIPA
jgi:hypothetical protein